MAEAVAHVSFGPYLLVRASAALGRLEMAVRTDVRDPEVCVLKRLPIRARTADAAARFRRQAQLAARLEHENVARTLRVEAIEGQVCVARELVEGMTLSKVMRQLGARPAPLIAALNIVHEVARGLAYAHQLNGMHVVHGEVAAENIMIAFSGQVKLIDFGIGRPAEDAKPGVVIGHRGCLPPEAASGQEPDQAGDIYGLGVVLWELLTGRRADDTPELPLPDVRALNPDVPEELARLVARATAVAPEARPRAADEVGAALTTFMPAGADAQHETALLLRACFDVDTLQPLLAADMLAARRMVTGEPPPDDLPRKAPKPARPAPARRPVAPVSAPLPERPARDARGVWVAALAVLALVAAGLALLRKPGVRPAPPAVAVAAPAPTALPPAPAPPAAPPIVQQPPAPLPPALPVAAPRTSRRPPDARATRNEGADRLLREADALFERGNTAGALARARQAVAAGAGAPAHVLMGTLLINLHNYKAAEPELVEAMREDPRNADAARLLALLHRTAAEQDAP